MGVAIVSPFPLAHADFLFRWLKQQPQWNFDDHSFIHAEENVRSCLYKRVSNGEITWEATSDGQPVGFIGANAINHHVATLRGICFDECVHGTGIPRTAMLMALDVLFEFSTIHRVEATYFSDNARVRRFLRKFGFRIEGTLRQRAIRDGHSLDMEIVGLLADDFQNCRERLRQSLGEAHLDASEAVPTSA